MNYHETAVLAACADWAIYGWVFFILAQLYEYGEFGREIKVSYSATHGPHSAENAVPQKPQVT